MPPPSFIYFRHSAPSRPPAPVQCGLGRLGANTPSLNAARLSLIRSHVRGKIWPSGCRYHGRLQVLSNLPSVDSPQHWPIHKKAAYLARHYSLLSLLCADFWKPAHHDHYISSPSTAPHHLPPTLFTPCLTLLSWSPGLSPYIPAKYARTTSRRLLFGRTNGQHAALVLPWMILVLGLYEHHIMPRKTELHGTTSGFHLYGSTPEDGSPPVPFVDSSARKSSGQAIFEMRD
ncbi:unnamed protein product [Diplocarpon coronariae]|nr:hypothetical protein JHW43_008376 [Diplocarpon mali]